MLRNDEFLIEVLGRGGRVYYTFRKLDGRWQQRVVNGKAHQATAEQVLNHLLPALAGVKREVEVTVRHVPQRDQARPAGGGRP